MSPQQRHLGLALRLATNRAFTGWDVRAFLQALLRHLRGAVVLRWDRGTIPTRREGQAYLAKPSRVSPDDFPPYAPELNPAEPIWNRADAALANGAPQDVDQLRGRLHQAIRKLRGSQRRLWSCVHASTLPWPR